MRVLLAFVLAGLLLSAPAGAQSQKEDKAQAREFASKAGDLLDEHQYAEALELVERAEALYHAPTHLLFKGEALDGLGRLTEAISTYERLVAEPLPAGAPKAYQNAQDLAAQRLRSLVARTPSLLIVVRGAASHAATTTIDGEEVELVPGVARRVNPGPHLIRVEASGYQPFEREESFVDKGGVTKLEVVLQPIEAPKKPKPRASTETRKKPPVPATRAPSMNSGASGGIGTPALVAFGFGAAGLAVGGVTGLMSLSAVNGLGDSCPDKRCAPSEQSNIDRARLLGNVSTGGFIVGGVGAAVGVLLWALSGETHHQKELAQSHQRWQLAGPTTVAVRF